MWFFFEIAQKCPRFSTVPPSCNDVYSVVPTLEIEQIKKTLILLKLWKQLKYYYDIVVLFGKWRKHRNDKSTINMDSIIIFDHSLRCK